ncbi:lyase family protein [Gymnodinialimonas hymeniacidonis]|uniref:lyase family protein n=1 Tax=Gymnodinialimonas hymeniacidonis TaxID=3126508 RepID=UPI0034C5E3F0
MSVSPFDSPMHRHLFGDAEVGRLFTDTAEVRAMMLVLGTLAKVQGEAGVIPQISGAFLHRSAMELQVDPDGLGGANGVVVPALVAAFRKALDAPEHGQYLHWGATSQDIQDTALMLRMRQVLTLIEARLKGALARLADLAESEAETPMAARTYGQAAVPSSFGAQVASWGWPVLRVLERLEPLRAHALAVSLSGAAGTASQLGEDPAALRAALAEALGLTDPGASWHADRSRVIELSQWLESLCSCGGKIGTDIMIGARSDIGELRLDGAGGSSTMPQKQNPVGPSVLVALSRFAPAQAVALTHPHTEARDGAGWFTEWLILPQLAMAAARSAALMSGVLEALTPDRDAMAAKLEAANGTLHAEALSFALAKGMGRPAAQAALKELANEAAATGTFLPDLVAKAHPDVQMPDLANLGQAPIDARTFAKAARAALLP